jgi:uncharacterized membrane protein YeaQ/YmgE (transglycosylase-associated protein family)
LLDVKGGGEAAIIQHRPAERPIHPERWLRKDGFQLTPGLSPVLVVEPSAGWIDAAVCTWLKPGVNEIAAQRLGVNKKMRREKVRFRNRQRDSLRTLTNIPMLHIIWSIIVGFIVGWIARKIMPGVQHLTFIMTTLLGIGGSIVGGLIGRLFSKPEPGSPFHAAGFIMSIVGAVILLFIWGKMNP